MFKKIMAGIGVFLVGMAFMVALQPSDFRVQRTAVIAAPAPEVFARVNDFRQWQVWSPWAKLDPAAKVSFEGSASGTGAVFRWTGNEKVGEGDMTILESRPNELVRLQLNFLKPFPGTCEETLAFKSEGRQTALTWTMEGKRGFIEKGVCLFMDMDKRVGGDFEKGLAQLKALVEAKANPRE